MNKEFKNQLKDGFKAGTAMLICLFIGLILANKFKNYAYIILFISGIFAEKAGNIFEPNKKNLM